MSDRLAQQNSFLIRLREETRGQGFASHLRALAKANRDDVWLEKIVLGQEMNDPAHVQSQTEFGRAGSESMASSRQIYLAGKALSTEAVPGFLLALSRQVAFQGQTFAELSIRREAVGKVVAFSIGKDGRS